MTTQRRNFLKTAALGAGIVASGAMATGGCDKKSEIKAQVAKNPGPQKRNMCGFRAEPIPTVRVGIVGLGMRGGGAVGRLSKIPGCKIVALCDLRPEKVKNAVARLNKDAKSPPAPKSSALYSGEEGWKAMCERDDLDLIYICTPWRWHTPMAVYAMKNGKHAATEVPAATTIDEAWELVNTSEATGKHCVILENCCYDFFEMMTLNMARQGAFGDVMYGEGAYIHQLVGLNFSQKGYQGMWRLNQNFTKDGNLYPTHGFGPVAQIMNINRGDRLDFISSQSTADVTMFEEAKKRAAKDAFYKPYAKNQYRGQMNNTMVKTKNGKSILIQHDVSSPRPYSRIHLVSGTKGIARKWPSQKIALSGHKFETQDDATRGGTKIVSAHRWLDPNQMKQIKAQFEHPLTKKIGKWARSVGGHGGMDTIMDYRLIHCLRNGQPVDMDCYDAAAWSCIMPLSEWSVANRSNSIDVPDFTRGAWRKNIPLAIVQ
ncbi:MAG: Gfo/Idh/MocA family oxidoreductase [Phycisphaerales bacterium]|jgi:predicted dehydrogenase|nr:Gfo/Idh/MocA family oxidoreductase [Phycisphaerales bacterium]MBT7170924.1 Gfo/Idh/MocA family oxidoreductase [Phycisphaerales bacterium]